MTRLPTPDRLPTPEDFAGLTPPDRIMGTETEADVQLPFDGSIADTGESYRAFIAREAAKRAGYMKNGLYLDNGMSVHETIKLVEIRTGESLGPRDTTESDMAAIDVLTDIVSASGQEFEGIFCYSATTIDRNTNSVGRHENYLMPGSLPDSPHFIPIMASVLASRLVNFSGTLGPDGFLLSQKAQSVDDPAIVEQERNTAKHGQKPMAIIKVPVLDDTTPDSGEWRRFEVRMSDFNQSDFASFVGFAAVSLALRLLEHPDIIDLDTLAKQSFREPAQAVKVFSRDLSLSQTAPTLDGSSISAVDYYDLLLREYRRLAERVRLPEDEEMAIPMLSRVNDELREANLERGEYGRLPKMLDFAARYGYLVERFGAHSLQTNHPDYGLVTSANLLYDKILSKDKHGNPSTGKGRRYWSNQPRQVVSDAAIQARKHTPPPTRAAGRSALIRQYGDSINIFNWGTGYISGEGYLRMPHPYDPEPPTEVSPLMPGSPAERPQEPPKTNVTATTTQNRLSQNYVVIPWNLENNPRTKSA